MNLTIRTEPRVATETFVYQIPSKGFELDVVSEELYNVGDKNCEIGWYKINYQGNERYVCGKWVTLGEVENDNPGYNEETFEARIVGVSAIVRATANSNSAKLAQLLPGTNVVILNKKEGAGCSAGWYQIKYYKGSTGYVCSSYVKTKEELTGTNSEYEDHLKSLGFPSTYIPYLVKLHELHPNWKFNAIKTSTDWSSLVFAELKSNYINSSYLNDTVNDIYQVGPSDETGWYIASEEVISFFLDPRNFLNEKFIFMYEKLHYDYNGQSDSVFDKNNSQSQKYYKAIGGVLGSAYSNTDEYKTWLLEGGFDSGVSPVYLAALSYQEGPLSKENNGSIRPGFTTKFYENGIGYDVSKYFNYYNIYARWYLGNDPVTTARAYACGAACNFGTTYSRPWDTREKALKQGAKWVFDNYINVGQDTIYYKKFNANPTNPSKLGTHQYQSNITAPCSESISMFNAYTSVGMIDEELEFDIPIFLNMPNIVNLPEIASNVNTIEEIKIDGKKIANFDKDVVEYNVYVQDTKDSVQIEVTKTHELSVVKGDGTINLTGQTTSHSIIVTAENGSTKTYKISIIKTKDTTTVQEIVEKLPVKINNETMYAISPETQVNSLVQNILKASPETQVTVYNASGNAINSTSLIVTGGSIKIIAPSGETKTYTTIVTGDTNGDGEATILDLLRIQKHILKSSILTGNNLLGADTNGDNQITILDLLRVQKHILKSIQL